MALRARDDAGMTDKHYNPDPHAHPGLHIIAIVEAVKGSLALLAASGLELIGPAPLQRWVHELIARFQLDPSHGAAAWLAQAINPGAVHLAAAVATLYGIVHLIEGDLPNARYWYRRAHRTFPRAQDPSAEIDALVAAWKKGVE